MGPNPVKGSPVGPFSSALERRGLSLVRGPVETLQVATGLLCDRGCRHCHLEAGPGRPEVMSRGTMEAVVAFARRVRFRVADITGGAPELVPDLPFLIEELSALVPRLLLRSALSGVAGARREALLSLCIDRRVALVASFPSTDPAEMDAQRGPGAADAAAAALRRLNAAGYGMDGSGLELCLVANPSGASLPPPQAEAETRFKREMAEKWGIYFNGLYTFANVPLGRFRRRLDATGAYEGYLATLAAAFNPCAVPGLMCRTLVSVSWDGYLFDCDFNLAAGRFLGERRTHVSEAREAPPPGTPIAVGDYCYACAAGSGFT